MRPFTSAFLGSTIVSALAVIGPAAYAGYVRMPALNCLATPTLSLYQDYSTALFAGPGGDYFNCPLPDDDIHPQTRIKSVWADFYFFTPEYYQGWAQLCRTYYGSPGGGSCNANTYITLPEQNPGYYGYTWNATQIGNFFSNNPYDYPFLSVTLSNGTLQGYGIDD
jgi:hypothetical protein